MRVRAARWSRARACARAAAHSMCARWSCARACARTAALSRHARSSRMFACSFAPGLSGRLLSLSRAGILAVAACLCATEADAFFGGASFGRLAPAVRAEKSTRPGKSTATMQFAFKMPQFNAPQFPTAGGGAAVKTVAVSGETPTAERIRPACRLPCSVAWRALSKLTSPVFAGTSGLVGSALSAYLSSQDVKVVPLGRGAIDPSQLEGVDAVVHLGGENVATGLGPLGFIGLQAWSDDKKAEIIRSRVEGTAAVVEAIKQCGNKGPKTLVCASGVGYYGYDTEDKMLDESSPMGSGFLASEVVPAWERTANTAPCRVVNARFGVILAKQGGALAKLLPIFLLGGGGVLGSGSQYFSWVSLGDVVAAVTFMLNNKSLKGPVNVCAPEPVTNAQFTAALGAKLFRPTILPVPEFAVKALFGQMGEEMVRYAGTHAPTLPRTDVPTHAHTHIHTHADTQIHRCSDTRIHRYTSARGTCLAAKAL